MKLNLFTTLKEWNVSVSPQPPRSMKIESDQPPGKEEPGFFVFFWFFF